MGPMQCWVSAQYLVILDRKIRDKINLPVMFGITALLICPLSRKYCPRSWLSGVRPKKILKGVSVAWKEEDFVDSKLPGGHFGEHSEDFGAGNRKSLLTVSIRRVAGCGDDPPATLTVYFYRID